MLDKYIIWNVIIGIFYYKLIFGTLRVFLEYVVKVLEQTIEEEEMKENADV